MKPPRNFRQQRIKANALKFKRMGQQSQKAQRQRKLAELDINDITDRLNSPREGTPVGCFQYHNFQTGEVRRWVILRGSSTNRFMIRFRDAHRSLSHGFARIIAMIGGYLSGSQSPNTHAQRCQPASTNASRKAGAFSGRPA